MKINKIDSNKRPKALGSVGFCWKTGFQFQRFPTKKDLGFEATVL
jgi:hypothetical protein